MEISAIFIQRRPSSSSTHHFKIEKSCNWKFFVFLILLQKTKIPNFRKNNNAVENKEEEIEAQNEFDIEDTFDFNFDDNFQKYGTISDV
jgi:hypothetical protein